MTPTYTFPRDLVVLDTETTGVDPVKDRIIELGVTVYSQDGTRRDWVKRFNPGVPIPVEATDIHDITDADVADCDPFSAWAPKILQALQGRDIAGYNLRRLDLPIIDEEMRRCGLTWDWRKSNIIDAAGIFFAKEQRNLSAAVQKYCGRSHDDAHGALPDAQATLDVLLAQLALYPDLAAMELPAVAAYSRMGDKDWVDLACKLYRDPDGDLRYGFGKVKDVKVKLDPGFGYWMLGKDFPGDTKDVLRAELNGEQGRLI